MVYYITMADKQYIDQEYSVAKRGKNIREDSKTARVARIFSISFFTFAVLISFTLIGFTIIFFFSRVEGSSMMMTLNRDYTLYASSGGNNTDAVLVNRRANPSRGDIIVVRHYHSFGSNNEGAGNFDFFIKRLIAVGGDSVYFRRHPVQSPRPGAPQFWYEIHLNGEPIDEYYLHPHWGQNLTYSRVWSYLNENRHASVYAQFIQFVPERERFEIVIPQGYMFFMGDNRGGSGVQGSIDLRLKSWDSTAFGPQPIDRLVGVVADVIHDNMTLPQYLWTQFVNIITFRFLWG